MSATAQSNIAGMFLPGIGSPQLGMGLTGFGGMSSFPTMGAFPHFSQQHAAFPSPWTGFADQYTYAPSSVAQQSVLINDTPLPPSPPTDNQYIQHGGVTADSSPSSSGYGSSYYTTVNSYSSPSNHANINYHAPCYTKTSDYIEQSYAKSSGYGGSSYGDLSYGGSPYGGSSYGGSTSGGSPYGGSSYGGSTSGSPPSDGPPSGGSPYGGLSYGGSTSGSPPSGGPPSGGSPYGGSSYGGSPYGGSSYGGSTSGSPPSGGSSYGGSSYGGSPKGGSSYGGSSYGGSSYGGSYNTPTGPPYGIQSTGEYTKYYPEVLDLSRCGPPPTENPCTLYGPQYFPLPGYPHCYIQCAFERLFVKPCPANLVWNPRINVCDWSTVAAPYSNNDYGSTSYGNKGDQYSSSGYETIMSNYGGLSSYPYGRKKRSTTERKKRGYTS